MPDLRYPIGKFEWIPPANDGQMVKRRVHSIAVLAQLPANLNAAVDGLSPTQLDTPYRPQGWTVRQVVHHVPDSHMQAYARFKLALTEERPAIKTYREGEWAKLHDSVTTPIEVSLQLLAALHARWIELLRSMQPADFSRSLIHPEHGTVHLDQMLAMYSWHSEHHTAHITSLRERLGWNPRASSR
jgi:hypothetical protein